MDKKISKKTTNFFKREGFYVVLFVCLCIVATIAVVTVKGNKSDMDGPPSVQHEEDLRLSEGHESKEIDINNALQVKDNNKKSEETIKVEEKNEKVSSTVESKDSAAVSKSVDTKFEKPVEGSLVRQFTEETIFCDTLGTWRTRSGVDIKADLGQKVLAVSDGVVEKVDNDNTEFGRYMVIDHKNGLKTLYSNLEDDIQIKEGQKISKGQEIGKVGKTAGNYSEEKYGDHLHFEVLKDNIKVDPEKYVSYK
ncbi:M23 family metallopeptidase [Clostridium algidicarnis]|uniref:M23 family metallopeptidase n=1 Tax=Clostridium algidicarnis TaxID=37659 RepID=UPI0004984C6B|nr:M23 family metallopeptidase [Clostridium algidicarnis]MBB6698166.1 M23 family metallopeptidase [Clostridium algidicarnis]MBU3194206.1 M23 family metallopeptidase [Clostridium algidicarnis]MBU3203762.1 M23 family metallopeptidase [Clostridium algidicarnis]MBU3211916.1 M23 family metallopeptidase [Clostridium algidicarnis]MBU3221578.1 M23 family metallopeptidase [Clostridium algidicarnis]